MSRSFGLAVGFMKWMWQIEKPSPLKNMISQLTSPLALQPLLGHRMVPATDRGIQWGDSRNFEAANCYLFFGTNR